MQLEFTITNQITFSNALGMYREIICSETRLSGIVGLNVYDFYVELNNFKIESELPYSHDTFLIYRHPEMKARLPLFLNSKKNINFFLLVNNFYWKWLAKQSYGIMPYEYLCQGGLEEVMEMQVDSLEITQYYIMKLPFIKDRKIKLEKNKNEFSVLLQGNSLYELNEMANNFFKIIK